MYRSKLERLVSRLPIAYPPRPPLRSGHPCLGAHSQRRKATWGRTAPPEGKLATYREMTQFLKPHGRYSPLRRRGGGWVRLCECITGFHITFEGNYENISFYKTHFKGCTFGIPSEQKRTVFQSNNFSEATFEKGTFERCYFRGDYLTNSTFVSSTFKNVDFVDVKMMKSSFSGGTYIAGCQFIGADLAEVSSRRRGKDTV